MSLQGKTLFIWQIKVAKTAKAKLCVTKHGIGGPGTLWHIKALTYQKPQAKASESRFGTQKALPYLNPQAKAPDRRYQRQKRIPRRKPTNYPQNSASPNSGVLCLCKEKRSYFDKPRLQRLPKRLSLLFDYFAKSRVCLAFPKANTRSLHKTPANYPRILLCRILELLCLCREKRSFFDKPRLQRRQKRWSG